MYDNKKMYDVKIDFIVWLLLLQEHRLIKGEAHHKLSQLCWLKIILQ